jgi:RNA polymerase sigma factor (sigma-70 family)
MFAEDREQRENELIVVRCQLGELPALDELVTRWHLRLWRYIRCMVQRDEQAEESVQETWLRVLRGLPRLREPARFGPWFFGVAHRVLVDRLRTKYVSPAMANVDPDTLTDDDDVETLDSEDIACLHESLGRLPLFEREVLTLFYFENLTLQEVAEVAAVPEGTVKSRLHRARRMLRDVMEKKGTFP